MATKNILIVDDEAGIRELLSEILFDEGYGVYLAEDAKKANQLLAQHTPDIVLLDIWMPDTDGLTLLKQWKTEGKMTMPIIMMSGHGTIETALEAIRFGAVDFLEKPIALKKLLATVVQVLQQSSLVVAAPPVSEKIQRQQNEKVNIEIQFDLPFRQAREHFDTLYLQHHIDRCAGNIAEVADKVGIERTHLYRKLKQLGIKPPKRGVEEA